MYVNYTSTKPRKIKSNQIYVEDITLVGMSDNLPIQKITAVCLIWICRNARKKQKQKSPQKGISGKLSLPLIPTISMPFFHFNYIHKETTLTCY